MRRRRLALGLAAVACGVWAAWPPGALPARFGPGDCARVALVDDASGAAIFGAEDLALAPDGALIVAARDRLGGGPAGLWRIAPDAWGGPVLRLARLPGTEGVVAPQGLAIAADGRIAVVDRGAAPRGLAVAEGRTAGEEREGAAQGLAAEGSIAREDRAVQASPGTGGEDRGGTLAGLAAAEGRIGGDDGAVPGQPGGAARGLAVAEGSSGGVWLGRIGGEGAEVLRDPTLCRANDLVFDGARLVISLDRAECGVAWTDLVPWGATGRLVAWRPGGVVEPVAAGIAYANGVALWRGALVVAATRGGTVGPPGAPGVAVPGGPDNLSVGPGGVIAALHADLVRLALYRAGWAARAPSRIARVLPDIEVLFDDPGGAFFSAATVALWVGPRLVAGSVRDAGLLVCGGPGV